MSVLMTTLITSLCTNYYVARYLPMELNTVHMVYYLSALVEVESSSNPKALSPAGAVGLTQMTRIAYKELQTSHQALQSLPPLCKPELPFAETSLQDPELAIRYGACYLQLMKVRYHTWHQALIAYNGGNRQVRRYRRGLAMAGETANYVIRIMGKVEQCITTTKELPWIVSN